MAETRECAIRYVLMICSECRSSYLRDHPENPKYLKCGLCGYCVTRARIKILIDEAIRDKENFSGFLN